VSVKLSVPRPFPAFRRDTVQRTSFKIKSEPAGKNDAHQSEVRRSSRGFSMQFPLKIISYRVNSETTKTRAKA